MMNFTVTPKSITDRMHAGVHAFSTSVYLKVDQ